MAADVKKSVTFALGLGSFTGWRPRRESKVMQSQVPPDKVAVVQVFSFITGPLALSVTFTVVQPAPQILQPTVPASVLVDARGRALQ